MSSTKGNSGSMDAKREEFRKYLEKAGVLELLTKSLVQLYEVSQLFLVSLLVFTLCDI